MVVPEIEKLISQKKIKKHGVLGEYSYNKSEKDNSSKDTICRQNNKNV